MSAQWISAGLRAEIRDRAHGCCEYCRIHEEDTGAPHEPDHIIAEQYGGRTIVENLAYACYHCNGTKEQILPRLIPRLASLFFFFSLGGTLGLNTSELRAR
ncbi:MAG TPA: HNH endonuclease signature motif containing protein [Verrucomicrobiae bacterium]|jgi:5-methylcytosine-specific restriction endonuclease McrA|nr:HNH endonuclease signature motif containing protein [Verrucomicrobiae bacterium]